MQLSNELLRSLADEDPDIRLQGLSALTDLASDVRERAEIIDCVVSSLYDESGAVRSQAIYVASIFANRPLLDALAESLISNDSRKTVSDDSDDCSLWHALFALDRLVEKIAITSEERDRIAERVVEALYIIINEASTSALDIWKVGETLGEFIKGSVAFDALKKMMTHEDARVRDSAVHGLSHLGGADALELIKDALCDPSAEVSDEARKAIMMQSEALPS
jgi:HEAT repeat protein